MSPRLLILFVALLGIPFTPAYAQRYSNGIAADYQLIPNITYLQLGGWQGKLDL